MCAVKMPHVNEEGGEDLGSADEVKVFKEEGEEENEEQNLTEVKSSLINESEEVRKVLSRSLFVTLA